MTVTVVTGPPCGGKSTYVADTKTAGDVVVDFDAIAVALGSTSDHGATGDVRAAAYAARRAAVDVVLDGVQNDAWIIHTSPTAGALADYEAAGCAFVECDPGLEEALARANADERPPGTDDAIRAWYSQREGKATMAMKVKAFDATIVGVGGAGGAADLEPGQFRALVSVFDVVDSYGEVVRKGAFTRTLAEWAAKGDPIPVIWMHDWRDPFAHVGIVLRAVETDDGLLVDGEILDIAGDNVNAKAVHVHRLLKGRRITQFSFGFDVVEAGRVTTDGEDVYEIKDLTLFEVGPCLVGVNRATELVDAKSDAPVLAPVAPTATAPAATEPDPAPAGSDDQNGQDNPPSADDSEGRTPPEPSASKGVNPASLLLDTQARIMQNKE